MKTVKAASLPLRSCSLWSGAGLALVHFNSIELDRQLFESEIVRFNGGNKRGNLFYTLYTRHCLLSDIFLSFIFPMNDSCLGCFVPVCAPFRGKRHQGAISFPISSVISLYQPPLARRACSWDFIEVSEREVNRDGSIWSGLAAFHLKFDITAQPP